MSAQILDGKQLAKQIQEDLKKQVVAFQEEYSRVPKIANILIGQDAGSCAYAASQRRNAEAIGIVYDLIQLPEDISQQDLAARMRQLNEDPEVNGIMLHKPVPAHIDYHTVANSVNLAKDLEGINVANIGRMLLGQTNMLPCTPQAVMAHIQSTGMSIRGKEAVIVGASGIVGKPLSILLLEAMATVTVCHIATSEAGQLEAHVKRADLLVVAVGKAKLIPGDWIKEGAVVIDVGINRIDGKVVGDVDFEAAKEKASFITPVPGGVGPVTVMMLMKNGVEAFKLQTARKKEGV